MIRLSLSEVQKVLRLASNRGMISPSAGPTVKTVADAFGLQPWQVEKLLTEVREQEAEAPQWRKLRAIGTAVGALALLGLSFALWQTSASRSWSSSTPGGRAVVGPGGEALPLRNYAGASFTPQKPGISASMRASDSGDSALQRHYGRGPMFADAGPEQAVLPRDRYAKTDASDLNNARTKANDTGYGSSAYGRDPRTGANAVAPSGR